MAFFIITIPVQLILGLTVPLLLLVAALHQLWRPSSSKIKIQQEKKLPLPPGRFGLPFIGETLELLRTQRKGIPWKFYDDRISAYGETFKTSLMASPTVILASPLGNKAAFSNSYTAWPASIISIIGTKALSGQVGPHATRIRNALMMFLRPESLQRYTMAVDLIMLRFIREHLESKSEVLLFPLMKKLTFTIACEVLIGQQDPKDQDMLLLPFETMMKGIMQLPINIPGTRYQKALTASDVIRKHLQGWMDERRRHIDGGLVTEHQDILSELLTYTDEHGQSLSDKEVKDNILMLLFAGHDTSSIVATMACKYLASNPHIMDEVYRGLFVAPPQYFSILDQCLYDLYVFLVWLAQRTRRSRQARPPARI